MFKMRTITLGLILAIGLSGSSFAADNLPGAITKAPAAAPYAFNNSNFFGGIYTEGGGGSVSANVPGVASASLTTTTAAIGLTAGYVYHPRSGPFLYTLESDVAATNYNGNNAGFALSGPLSFEQRAMVFAPSKTFTDALSFLSLPNLFGNLAPINPGNATVTSSLWGFGAGAYWKDMTLAYQGAGSNKVWSVAPEIVAMIQDTLSNGAVVRTFLKTSFPDKGAIFGARGSSAVRGPEIRAGLGVEFGAF